VLTASIIRAISISETSVNFYQTTRRSNPEDSHLHIHRRENLKSHRITYIVKFMEIINMELSEALHHDGRKFELSEALHHDGHKFELSTLCFIAAKKILTQMQAMCARIECDLLPQMEDVWVCLKYGHITIFHVFRDL
jgi:hypothetical protein